MIRVNVKPELLRWARERARRDVASLLKPFPKLEAWERGEVQPTLKQLERFAKTTHTPIGYLFLPEPPVERIPIPDFRTVAQEYIDQPSPDLLDTIYLCQQRQEWYHNFMRSTGEKPLSFVSSADRRKSVKTTAATIRHALNLDIEERQQMPTWTEALRHFIKQADELGVLVMVNGVVGSNNRRKLNPQEFRGFALTDNLAPLIFINGADTKAAQMFTLAHELAHIWLGQSAVSNTEASWIPENHIERWCNQVAAELLVPLEVLRHQYDETSELQDQVNNLARYFKVSTLVILRRIHDAGGLTKKQFWQAYQEELTKLQAIQSKEAAGGNFYLTLEARVSKRFAHALVVNTLEGQTLYRDALRMLGFSKIETFHKLGRNLGIDA